MLNAAQFMKSIATVLADEKISQTGFSISYHTYIHTYMHMYIQYIHANSLAYTAYIHMHIQYAYNHINTPVDIT